MGRPRALNGTTGASSWEFIGYSPQVDNDEVDAYLLTYIYIKILEVFRKHDKVVNR